MIPKAKSKCQERNPRKNLLQSGSLKAKSLLKTSNNLVPIVYLFNRNQKSEQNKRNNFKTKVLASKIPTLLKTTLLSRINALV